MTYKSGYYPLVSLTKLGIDGTSAATTTIAVPDPGVRFVPMFINFEPTAVTGVVSVPTVSVGTNSTSFNNILAASALTGLTGVNTCLQFSPTAFVSSVSPATTIAVKITSTALATTYTLRVSVVGFYY